MSEIKQVHARQIVDSRGNPRVAQALTAVTTRLLQQFAAGPAGTAHPAVDNVAQLGIHQTSGSAAPADSD